MSYSMWTDVWKLMVTFCKFANAPKNGYIFPQFITSHKWW